MGGEGSSPDRAIDAYTIACDRVFSGVYVPGNSRNILESPSRVLNPERG